MSITDLLKPVVVFNVINEIPNHGPWLALAYAPDTTDL